MATRSAIGYKTTNGKIRAVYAHWDGYPEHNGAILNKHYTDFAKVTALVEMGDISSLGEQIGEKHPFSQFGTDISDEEWNAKFGNMTTFYGRDRGESNIETREFDSVAAFVEHYASACCEYYYLFNGEDWIVNEREQRDELGLYVFDFVVNRMRKDVMKQIWGDDVPA